MVAVGVVVLLGAIAIVGAIWIFVRAADPVTRHSPSPLELAHQMRVARVGCDDWFRVNDPDVLLFDDSIDEVGCGTGQSSIRIARFENGRVGESAAEKLLCAVDESRAYVLGAHWVIYPASTTAARAISDAVGGTVEVACS